MQHTRFPEMTFQALSARADEVQTDDTVSDIIGGEDHREITAFLEFDQSCDMRGDDITYKLVSKQIIGVALCDLDDPHAPIEIWDRDTAYTEFGSRWVELAECVA